MFLWLRVRDFISNINEGVPGTFRNVQVMP